MVVRRVGVVGSGIMGTGIAQTAAAGHLGRKSGRCFYDYG